MSSTSVHNIRHSSGASAEVYLYGATVTRYKNAEGKELIFTSSKAALDGTKAIRGGIPIVFPVFGAPKHPGVPRHGFARTATWKLENGSGDGSAVFTLSEKEATCEAWAHPYVLRYEVKVSASELSTELTIENPSTPFTCQALQHTYLRVPDVRSVKIKGLEGRTYMDQMSDSREVHQGDTPVTIQGETDRMYLETEREATVEFEGGSTHIVKEAYKIDSSGDKLPVAIDTVTWNPWAESGGKLADMEEDGYLRFVCVEPGLVSASHVVGTGEKLVLLQIIS